MLTPLSRPVSPDQGLNNTTHLFLQKSRAYQHRHGVHGNSHAPTERSVGADWTDTVNHGPMHAQGRQLPGRHVGRAVLHGRLSSRSPHAALGGATPFSKIHKEADMTGLRVIGATAFVHTETYTAKMGDKAANSAALAPTAEPTVSTTRKRGPWSRAGT